MFSFFKSKVKKVLSFFTKTGFSIGGKLKSLFSRKVDESLYEDLEELLYEADLGTKASLELTELIRSKLRKDQTLSSKELLSHIRTYLLDLFTQEPSSVEHASPHVIMIVGVNGSGKTTSVAKLAKHYHDQGKKVLVAACDTFRAAAIDQLCLWADKLNIEIIKTQPGSDPAAVAYDAVTKAQSKGFDIVLIDTAGRLQTKTELMHELEKVKRVIQKKLPEAPHETLLVVDATTGQNAIDQATVFHKHTPLTGLLLTKFDGTAKGGVVVSIYKNLSIPVKWIGVGEKEEDLLTFKPEEFVDALLETT